MSQAKEATKEAASEAVGSLLLPTPGSLASFPTVSATVGGVWAALKQLPAEFLASPWVPLGIAFIAAIVSFLLNFPERAGTSSVPYPVRIAAGVLLIPLNAALLAGAVLGGGEAVDKATKDV